MQDGVVDACFVTQLRDDVAFDRKRGGAQRRVLPVVTGRWLVVVVAASSLQQS
jgi:hypothetical protein